MSSMMQEIIQLLKDEKATKQEVLKEEMQSIANSNPAQETALVNEPDMTMPVDETVLEDPNLLLDPALNFEMNDIEQKKIMLIGYLEKLIDKIVNVRDHIDSLSFDSVMSNNAVISASQLQFNLEELKTKVSRYIENQFETDKYERSLYVYLSFMEELKLIVKLLQRQVKKLQK